MRIRSGNRFITVQKGNYASQCQQHRNMTLETYYLENRNSRKHSALCVFVLLVLPFIFASSLK